MKVINFLKYISILIVILSVMIVVIEGLLSFYFSSNYFYHKDKIESYKTNKVLKKIILLIPTTNKKKQLEERYLIGIQFQ